MSLRFCGNSQLKIQQVFGNTIWPNTTVRIIQSDRQYIGYSEYSAIPPSLECARILYCRYVAVALPCHRSGRVALRSAREALLARSPCAEWRAWARLWLPCGTAYSTHFDAHI